jgi:hypothetical protein
VGNWKLSGLGYHYEFFMYLRSVAIDKDIFLKISTTGHINICGNFRIYDVVHCPTLTLGSPALDSGNVRNSVNNTVADVVVCSLSELFCNILNLNSMV